MLQSHVTMLQPHCQCHNALGHLPSPPRHHQLSSASYSPNRRNLEYLFTTRRHLEYKILNTFSTRDTVNAMWRFQKWRLETCQIAHKWTFYKVKFTWELLNPVVVPYSGESMVESFFTFFTRDTVNSKWTLLKWTLKTWKLHIGENYKWNYHIGDTRYCVVVPYSEESMVESFLTFPTRDTGNASLPTDKHMISGRYCHMYFSDHGTCISLILSHVYLSIREPR